MKDVGVVDREMLIEKDAGKRGKDYMDNVNVKATGKEQDSGHFTKQVE